MVSFSFHQASIRVSHRKDGSIPSADTYVTVLKNNNLSLPKNIFEMNQVHGDTITHILDNQDYPQKITATDGLITNRLDTALLIKTADCLPLVFTSTEKPVIAAIHAGWKGLVSDIQGQAVAQLKKKFEIEPKQLYVYIGPSIHECCYIFPDKPSQADDPKWYPHITLKKDGWHISLQGLAKASLIEAGIPADHITVSHDCTCHQSNDYFSYFRHKQKDEPMGLSATVVQLMK